MKQGDVIDTSDLADELEAVDYLPHINEPIYLITLDLRDRIITALRSNRAAIVEECAKVVRSKALQVEYPHTDWGDGFLAGAKAAEEAIRSLNGGDHE